MIKRIRAFLWMLFGPSTSVEHPKKQDEKSNDDDSDGWTATVGGISGCM